MKWTTKNLALCAVLTALALGLSTLESLFPVSLVVPLPGVKLGLANIVTVFALYELGAAPALVILLADLQGSALVVLFTILLCLDGASNLAVLVYGRMLRKARSAVRSPARVKEEE